MKKQLLILTMTSSLFFLNGCISQGGLEGAILRTITGVPSQTQSTVYPNTREIEMIGQQQKQAMMEALQQKVARGEITQSQAQQLLSSIQDNSSQSSIPNSPSQQISMTEAELQQKISQYPKVTVGVKFEKERDGFSINGDDVYIDPEGQIVSYGYNWKDGSFFYLVRTGSGYKVKFNRVNSQKESLTIATMQNSNGVSGSTVSGKKFGGDGIIPTSTGFIITRYNTAIIYTASIGMRNFSAPKGWHIASAQNGDVASTKYILLEKDATVKNGNPLSELFEVTKELGATLGMNKKQDYMLMGLENGKQYLLDKTLGDKEVALYSQCRQSKHKYVNYCDQMDMRQSLYQANGLKNFEHYYWTVNWFNGRNTIFSITKERSNKIVIIKDLNTGKNVEAAYRVTGFPEFQATQDSDGIVKLHVYGGLLPNVDISDSEEFLQKSTAIKVNE